MKRASLTLALTLVGFTPGQSLAQAADHTSRPRVVATEETLDAGAGPLCFSPPAGWYRLAPSVPRHEPILGDLDGNGARVTIASTAVPAAGSRAQSMCTREMAEALVRVERGELVSCEKLDVDGVPGFVIVDPRRRPLQQGLVWTGFGGGAIHTVSCWSEPAFFAAYSAAFRSLVESVRFGEAAPGTAK